MGGGEGSRSRSRSDWGELTHECLTNILSRLSFEERWSGHMLVCKSWLRACKDPSLFSIFDLESRFHAATDSHLWWSPVFSRKIDSMLRSVLLWSHGSLTVIRIRHCSDHSLASVSQSCPNLRVLSIKSCPSVTDASISKIASGCPMLTELDISYCYQISHESMELIGRKCPNLKILKRNLLNWLDPSQHIGVVPNEYLDAYPRDGDLEAAVIGKFMPHLEHLELRFSKLSPFGLSLISGGCLKLEYLDLFGCANLTRRDISNASANLKNMKTLLKPNFYFPRSIFRMERYGHWNLYNERFQRNNFGI
ncbi:hypothetical protein HHK36_006411 [Tetracentron sinense]|uniref:F-box domain-containing protein n=1 Tax=Tetracentron sinense TaxID=13715 RepID=A0A835DP66_TETSI|nr:hypothetical protein HHK36_006411 [Tetracentron sinense]